MAECLPEVKGVVTILMIWWKEGRVKLGFVDLGYGTDTQGCFIEFNKYRFERKTTERGGHYSLGCRKRVGVDIRVKAGHEIAHFCGKNIGARGSPLTKLDKSAPHTTPHP